MASVSSGMNANDADPEPDREAGEEDRREVGGGRPDGREREQAGRGARHAGREDAERPEAADEPCRHALREHRDGERPGQERGAGLEGAVVADVLEVKRAEGECRSTSR